MPIDTSTFCQQLSDAAQHPISQTDPDSLVGVLQKFRPDGEPVDSLFSDIPFGPEVTSRLKQVFEFAGDPRRADGMADAYFLVRSPDLADADAIAESGSRFFENLQWLAHEIGRVELAEALSPVPDIRVVEGKAPKHPRADHEKSDLLRLMQSSAPFLTREMIKRKPTKESEFAELLTPAFYFIACDPFLRDYLLWPFFREQSRVQEPFTSYFDMWKYGVKYRIFNNRQIDLYLPRVFEE